MIVKEAFPEYSKPSIAVDTVILRVCDFGEVNKRQVASKKLQVLLVKKYNEDKWHLPGTIMRLGETSLSAISRIMKSSTNIDNMSFEQLYTVDNDVNRDERGHIISIVYIGMYNNSNTPASSIISSEYESQWFWVNKNRSFVNVDTGEEIGDYFIDDEDVDGKVEQHLMYDHENIIDDTIQRLKGKLLYTDIGFNFVGERFTIRELENTFEAINERQIPGFRRIIADKIEGIGIMSDGNAFRPAELYRKKNKHIV